MESSEEHFWEYSKLPSEVQGNVMRQMDGRALLEMRAASKGSRDLVDVELARRRRILSQRAQSVHDGYVEAAMTYLFRVGEFPPEQMPYGEINVAKDLRVVEASSYSSFSQQDPPINPDDEVDILLRIPEGTEVVGERAFEIDYYSNVSIKHVHFPLGLQKIDLAAFKTPYFAAGKDLSLFSNFQLYFPETLQIIEAFAFQRSPSGGTLRFPKSLTYIGFKAFASCNNTVRIEFAEGSTVRVGEAAFAGVPATVHIPATARLNFKADVRPTFSQATSVECTAEFLSAHRTQFPRNVLHVELPAGGGAAAAEDDVAGRMKRMANPNPKRPSDLATITLIESTV